MHRPKPSSHRNELEILFIDMNAYFASCEQMDHPELRGLPVGVTPVLNGSGCCIATSYEARNRGVKVGCRVRDARAICPDIRIVQSRPDRYITIHHQILDAIDTVLPVAQVDSIDECWCRLLANERPPEIAEGLAMGIKRAIAERVGSVTCSIGIAPNRLLAKVAGNMHKPDGLTIIRRSDLPGPLLDLDLTDLPGIAKGVNRRLRAAGIMTMADLYARTSKQLNQAWGSVLGDYWWHWLRGDHLPGPVGHRRTVGHSHVLAPEFRDLESAKGVSLRLLAKATQRMRSLSYCASRISLTLHSTDTKGYGDWSPIPATNDTINLHKALLSLWGDALRRRVVTPASRVFQVAVRLEGLSPVDTQLPLFTEERDRRSLMAAIDTINLRQGADAVYLGSMHGQRKSAPRRIPFGTPPSLELPDNDGW